MVQSDFIIFILYEIVHVIFAHLLSSRTTLGEEVITKIRGFKKYLETAEVEDLKLMNKSLPDQFEVFQKYLPYAISFGVQIEWTKKFENVLSQINMDSSIPHSITLVLEDLPLILITSVPL